MDKNNARYTENNAYDTLTVQHTCTMYYVGFTILTFQKTTSFHSIQSTGRSSPKLFGEMVLTFSLMDNTLSYLYVIEFSSLFGASFYLTFKAVL